MSEILLWIIVPCLCLLIFYREYVHQSDIAIIRQDISQQKTEFVQTIQIFVKHLCNAGHDNATCSLAQSSGFTDINLLSVTKPLPSSSQKEQWVAMNDGRGWRAICVLMLAMYAEIRYVHSFFLQELTQVSETSSNSIISKTLVSKIRTFLLYRSPVMHFLFFAIVYVLGLLAWTGIIDKSWFIFWSTRMILHLSSAIPLHIILHNALHIYQYLPSTTEQWIAKIKDREFWLWLFVKLIGLDSVYQISQGLTSLIVIYSYIMGYRYIFHYQHDGLKNDHLESFVLNMLIHSSFAWIWLFHVLLVSLGSPSIVRRNRLLRWFGNDMVILVFSGIQVLNVLLAVLRILWFVFGSSSCQTWMAWVSMLSFMLIYALICMMGLPAIGLYMQRALVMAEDRATFVEQFVSKAQSIINEQSKSEQTINSRKDMEEAGNSMFDLILDKTLIVAMFLSDDEAKLYDTPEKGIDGNESNNGVSFFRKIFRRVGYSIASSIHGQDNEEDNPSTSEPSAKEEIPLDQNDGESEDNLTEVD